MSEPSEPTRNLFDMLETPSAPSVIPDAVPAQPVSSPSKERQPGSLYDISPGCICMGDGLMGMPCDAPTHAKLRNPSKERQQKTKISKQPKDNPMKNTQPYGARP